MSKRLELKFTDEQGKIATISIDDPVDPVNATDVSASMDEILTQDVFTSSGGRLVAKKSARVVERVVSDIQLP